MHRDDVIAHAELCAQVKEKRVDWGMRQYVDNIAAELEQGSNYLTATSKLFDRGVPVKVIARVVDRHSTHKRGT